MKCNSSNYTLKHIRPNHVYHFNSQMKKISIRRIECHLICKGRAKIQHRSAINVMPDWKITFPAPISRATNPRNSYSGQCFEINDGEITTRPNRDLDKPSSMLLLKLSPSLSVNSSYQTRTPNSVRIFARGWTKSLLSSDAWDMNTSHDVLSSRITFVPQFTPPPGASSTAAVPATP